MESRDTPELPGNVDGNRSDGLPTAAGNGEAEVMVPSAARS